MQLCKAKLYHDYFMVIPIDSLFQNDNIKLMVFLSIVQIILWASLAGWALLNQLPFKHKVGQWPCLVGMWSGSLKLDLAKPSR